MLTPAQCAKLDGLVQRYHEATDKAGFLAEIWGGLNMAEADHLFERTNPGCEHCDRSTDLHDAHARD